MRSLFLTKQKNPKLLPLIAADYAWGRLKERNRGSRIEAECLTVFNQAADLSTYRKGKSVRTTRATSLVTALNAAIGYEKGAQIAKQAYKDGRAVREVARELTDLSEEDLARLLDPAQLTQAGVRK